MVTRLWPGGLGPGARQTLLRSVSVLVMNQHHLLPALAHKWIRFKYLYWISYWLGPFNGDDDSVANQVIDTVSVSQCVAVSGCLGANLIKILIENWISLNHGIQERNNCHHIELFLLCTVYSSMNNVKLLKKSDVDLEEINKLNCNSLKIINLSTHFRTAMVGLHIKVFLLTAIFDLLG